ncbi:Uncharacterized protein ALO44_05673 [Pseudomonas syringae pv. tagetis]|uniref:Uncharacterized protein n=1 Tax=Pseudomonas syringae pv. tagetis TaxID=129140 RepID=A0A0Q0B1P2_9PSED|nr:Uncharacterized protein ALO44_05673 [Pseudomonas syringae pv. tagetis]RMW16303.1 hypothetical protein ALO98_05365 [Pseudomonas syringae pv. tagetis]
MGQKASLNKGRSRAYRNTPCPASLGLWLLAQTDVQLSQRLGIDNARRLGHDIGSALGFRESDYFTDRLRSGHQHDQTVKAERQTTVRRCTVLQSIEQEAEFFLLLVFGDAQQTEDRLLHFLAVNTNRTTAQLGTVEHHVVGTGKRRCRVGFQLFRRALGCREGVMQCGEAAVVVFFEHREINDPHRSPFAGMQLEVVADLDPQRAKRFADDLELVRPKENDIAIDRTHTIEDDIQVVFRDELDDRRLQAFRPLRTLIDLDVGQAFGTVDTDELGVVVDLAARHAGSARYTQCGNAPLGIVGRAAEHFEFHASELIGNVHQFQRIAQVWLVGAVATHGLFEGHVREVTELQVQNFLEQLANHLLGQTDDVLFIEETGLDVDLSEFRLAVGTQVFVAEALGDLVVTVEASHHQQLLEQLRRLRQGEEAARVCAAWNQIVTSTFWRRAGQDRRLDIEEAVVIQIATDAGSDARTQTQLLGHFRATQIDEAITQTGFLAYIGVFIQRERRSLGLVQHFELVTQHLDGTGRHVRVHGTRRTSTNLAHYLDHVLAAHSVSGSETVGTIGVEHDLSHAFTVANIEEDNASVVTTTVDPSAKGDFLAFQTLVQLAAIMAAHHDGVFTSRNSNSVALSLLACAQWYKAPAQG